MTELDVEDYLKGRLEEQIAYYAGAANRAKQTHLRLQVAIIVLSVLMPVIVNRPPDWGGNFHFLIMLAAVLLPAMTGLANLRKYGEIWLSYRMTEELLKNEKYLFLTRSGRYRDSPHPFQELVETVESLLSAEHNKFRTFFAEVPKPTPAPARGASPAAPPDEPPPAPATPSPSPSDSADPHQHAGGAAE
ncbi:MAG TPA: DUF4231 domain-containing protein [Thermoanaerobaculia bacterium]|nr:DUF4231 domain-containing protein [Thermoanaerobaculia bacterium]